MVNNSGIFVQCMKGPGNKRHGIEKEGFLGSGIIRCSFSTTVGKRTNWGEENSFDLNYLRNSNYLYKKKR